MKINETFQYEDVNAEDVYGLVSSQEFRTESADAQGSLELDLSVEPNGDGHTINIKRKLPAELPDFIKRLTGDTVEVHQVEEWSGPSADGSRTATVLVKIVGQPASMKGTSTIAPAGHGATMTITGEVQVKIPLIGRKIEPEIAKTILSSIRQEVELGTSKFD